MLLDYCSLFFSEKYWRKYFNRTPPGLIGAGSGLSLGEYYVGPWIYELAPVGLESITGPAYTRKDFSCFWSFYSDEQ